MATKHVKLVTYCKGLLRINLNDPIIMWYHEIPRYIRKGISPFPEKLKTYEHQTTQVGDLSREALTQKIT